MKYFGEKLYSEAVVNFNDTVWRHICTAVGVEVKDNERRIPAKTSVNLYLDGKIILSNKTKGPSVLFEKGPRTAYVLGQDQDIIEGIKTLKRAFH